MSDALVLSEVTKVYEVGGVEVVALDQVDLAVAEHEVVTLLGPSGSGKTTLLSIAGGLLSASSGRVVVGGQDITRAKGRKLTRFRRRQVGFIFQAVNLVPFLTARENLLVVAELAGRRRGEAGRRADRLLDELGLGHRVANLPAQLSGGERQRVAIGRALMNAPALVLVDEPTSALDSDLGQQVMELIVAEVKNRGAAAVVVTHDARMARYGDRILNMADGRLVGVAPRPEWATQRPVAVAPTAPDPPFENPGWAEPPRIPVAPATPAALLRPPAHLPPDPRAEPSQESLASLAARLLRPPGTAAAPPADPWGRRTGEAVIPEPDRVWRRRPPPRRSSRRDEPPPPPAWPRDWWGPAADDERSPYE